VTSTLLLASLTKKPPCPRPPSPSFSDHPFVGSLPAHTLGPLPSAYVVDGSSPKQPWKGGGRGSGLSPLTRAFAGSKPNLPLYLSVLYAAPILGEGRPTGTTNRLTARDTFPHTDYTLPPEGVVWATCLSLVLHSIPPPTISTPSPGSSCVNPLLPIRV